MESLNIFIGILLLSVIIEITSGKSIDPAVDGDEKKSLTERESEKDFADSQPDDDLVVDERDEDEAKSMAERESENEFVDSPSDDDDIIEERDVDANPKMERENENEFVDDEDDDDDLILDEREAEDF